MNTEIFVGQAPIETKQVEPIENLATGLLPCPFCGYQPYVLQYENKRNDGPERGLLWSASIHCFNGSSCGAEIKVTLRDRLNNPTDTRAAALRDATNRWNRRVEGEDK